MTRCTDTHIGKLLHAYELKQLGPDEAAAFEEHLLTCNYCFNEVEQFEPAAALLANDTEVKQLAAGSARGIRTESFLTKLKAALWPQGTPALLKPAVTYIALALLAYPAYLGLRGDAGSEVRSTQTVILSGTRSETPAIAAEQPLSLVFRVSGANPTDTLIVRLADDSGRLVFEDDSFVALSAARLGTISLSERALPAGRYFLTVATAADSQLVEYTFQVE